MIKSIRALKIIGAVKFIRIGIVILILMATSIFLLLNRRRRDDFDLFYEDSGTIRLSKHQEHDAHGVLIPIAVPNKVLGRVERSRNYAYITLACDNADIEHVRVLAFALQRAKSGMPLIVMRTPFANERLDELVALGALIREVRLLNVPFQRKNGKRPSFKKICKYSKINAWSFYEYEKLVYLDPTLLVVSNIDEIFNFEQFSAVKVVGDDFNTGVFVMKPDPKTFTEMMESYRNASPNSFGEQGFINWYFSSKTTHVISARYNTVLRQKDYAVWPMLRRNAKVFHFVPHTTPWNFYINAHNDWDLNFEPIIFFYWNQLNFHSLQAASRQEEEWINSKRSLDICSPLSTSYTPKKFVIQNKFSILIGTWDRIPLLRKLIIHYQKSRLVHKIYVTWHNPNNKPPVDFVRSLRKKPPVEILMQKYDSLNNRFNPIPNLETKAILICDDDIRVNVTDIEYAFEVWRGRQNSLVGVFPRYHSFNSQNLTFNYEIRSPERPRQYSIMLTKFMFINAEFLYTYTCLLPSAIHKYIDDHMNCEDIAMNLLVSGMTGSKPTAVLLHIDDFGTTSGISVKAGHLTSRSQCMTDLIRLFGRDTLRYNREVFLPFRKKKN